MTNQHPSPKASKEDAEFLRYWAYCRVSLGLSELETRTYTPRQIRALKKQRDEDILLWMKFLAKEVARVNYMTYLTHCSDRKIKSADELLGFGNKPDATGNDLTRKEGMEAAAKAFSMAVKKAKEEVTHGK
jgi:hypothetical protein